MFIALCDITQIPIFVFLPCSQTASVRRGCSATVHLSGHCPVLFSKWGIFAKSLHQWVSLIYDIITSPCKYTLIFFLSFCEREANVAHDQCSVREKRLSEGDAYWLVARKPSLHMHLLHQKYSFVLGSGNEASKLRPLWYQMDRKMGALWLDFYFI